MLIALTGGIGSGKSTVAAEWVRLGATEVDSDLLAREVVEPGTRGLDALVSVFGDGILTQEGALDRPKLAEIVFSNPQAKKTLEGILHPLIQELAKTRTAGTKGMVVYTIPLLYEVSSPLKFDKVVTVSCPVEIRVARLIERGLAETDARQRILAQASDADREQIADLVIDSNCDKEELLVRARQAFAELTSG
jgi:dephospho-CoA kinase